MSFIARITSLRPVAIGLAAGILVAGILAVVGGSYAKDVLHDQLAPQKIVFPASTEEGLPENLSRYAGERVDTAEEARAYAEDYIGLHLSEIAGGKTYAEVSSAAQANPDDEELAAQTQTLFRGETLRGLLLNAWGWGTVGTIATIAGVVLIVVGAVLLLAQLLAIALVDRRRESGAAA